MRLLHQRIQTTDVISVSRPYVFAGQTSITLGGLRTRSY